MTKVAVVQADSYDPQIVEPFLNELIRRKEMKKIRILLDYRCCPIWVFDEKGELMRNDLPDELRNDGLSTHNRTIFIRSVAEIEQGLGN